MTNPYAVELGSSVLESTTILSQLLRREGFSRDTISDIAIGEFLNNEKANIKTNASMHLLALKKALLYAIPVISIPGSNVGISLTSQVNTPAIQYDVKKNKATPCALSTTDKFRLIGLSFPPKLVNHLSIDVFPWKYFNQTPMYYEPPSVELSHLPDIKKNKTHLGNIFLINAKSYEDVELFNTINRFLARSIYLDLSPILASKDIIKEEKIPELKRTKPFLLYPFIDKLNEVLPTQIDKTYNMSFYEALHITMNSNLYDHIELLGFDSSTVNEYLIHLAYVKSQNIKVRQNMREVQLQLLMNTRAEKIAREKYPYLFDFTDRRCIFSKFNRFNIDKLPKQPKNDVQILLKKDVAAQQELLTNKCDHIKPLKDLRSKQDAESFKMFEQYIDFDGIDNKMYPCKICSYSVLCIHEVDLYESLSSLKISDDGSDQAYFVHQKIINKYKVIEQQRTGDEDTESLFTYYCKHCGGELGKSADIIQSSIKTQLESNISIDSNPSETSIYMYIASTIATNMNQSIVPMSKKAITKLIFDESKSEILHFLNHANKYEQENIDITIRYLSMVYALSGLISININKLKSSESILIIKSLKEDTISSPEPVSGGADLKNELIAALKIMKSNSIFKRIGVSDDKIKTMLINAFKSMNKTFASETIQLKSRTPKDRLMLDILSSPITAYASFMSNRDGKQNSRIEASGVNIDSLFPKSKKTDKPITTHALYSNVFKSQRKENTDLGKYLQESYQSIVTSITEEPIKGRYTSTINPPLSSFVKEYEHKQYKRLKINQQIPNRFLPVENSREYDFQLTNYQIAYCLNTNGISIPHRWGVAKHESKLVYTCKHCGLDIMKASKSNNSQIEFALEEQMMIEAFFELYTLSCPIKDAHVYENDACSQCGVTKEQLSSRDPKYYKKYSSTYQKYRTEIISDLVSTANTISKYSTPIGKIENKDLDVKPDMIKLESIASSLSKLYGYSNLHSIGMDSSNLRSYEIIESYVRLFYSHYIFVKNLSIDIKTHPDVEFFAFVKESFFDGIRPKKFKLEPLPEYPKSSNPDQLLLELFQIMYDLASKADTDNNLLIKYILKKIVEQDSRRKEFNFAKLKSVAVPGDETEELIKVNDVEEEEEFDMFNGYDMDQDDMEDNIHGDLD